MILIIILSSLALYSNFFSSKNESVLDAEDLSTFNNSEIEKKNSQIDNLTYNIKVNENDYYILNSKYSELKYENNIEMIHMINVEAKFLSSNELSFVINSDNATFNTSNNNTNFKNNVIINYLDNTIFSDELILDMSKNQINIFKNVKYIGSYGTIKTDNIIIDLITKNIEIFMINQNENVKVKVF